MYGLSGDHLLFMLQGTLWTIVLSLMGFVGGAVAGLPLAILRASQRHTLVKLSGLIIHLIQGIPLPVLLFVVYFGLSVSGFEVSAMIAAAIALTAYSGVYLGEIWKGCIQAIPRTQREAAECLALSPLQTLIYVILPQAARIAIPPTVGFMVQIIKNSSYAVVIGFFDLTYTARVINNSTFQPFIVFSVAAVIYFALCYPLSRLARQLEQKYQVA